MAACCSANMLSSSGFKLAHIPDSFTSSRPCPPRMSVAVRCSDNNEETSKISAEAARSQPMQGSMKQDLSRADIERPASTLPSSARRPKPEQRPEASRARSLTSILAFDGAGPETINGRMAMVGFMWALAAEKLTGLTVTEQLFNPTTSGILCFGVVVPLFTVASLIPLTKGESTDGRAWGPFSTRAERWNGRLAMIGFAALLVNEMVRAGPLIHS